MSKLTSKDRAGMKKSTFGLPGEKKYPMPDKSHAGNAKARAAQQVSKGNLSKGSEEKIDAKANAILGKSQPHKHSQVKSDRGDFAFKENKPNRK